MARLKNQQDICSRAIHTVFMGCPLTEPVLVNSASDKDLTDVLTSWDRISVISKEAEPVRNLFYAVALLALTRPVVIRADDPPASETLLKL